MTALNDLNGVPASANPFTLTRVLRDEWRFDGFVVSDYNAVKELINHGLAADEAAAARLALMAGVDMEEVEPAFQQARRRGSSATGKCRKRRIDEAVRRVLRLKFRLGLFDRPYTDESQRPP